MQHPKPPGELTVMEAVDNLSNLAELSESVVAEEDKEGGIGEEEALEGSEHIAHNKEKVKETFRVIHHYLQNVYEKDKGELGDPETQRGIQAIMVLAGEAAQKVDRYTNLFKGAQGGVTDLKEYKELQQFYLTKIVKKFHSALVSEEEWQKQWGGSAEEDLLDIQRRGLKDLETVRRDKEYELFFIRKEDGRPFFNRNLLRHIRLVGEFDETVSDPEGEDPFLRIKVIQDRDVHQAAKEILHAAAPYIDEYYKEALRHKDVDFVNALSKAIMALSLSANVRNLMENSTGKSCISYYADFHHYLRQAMGSEEYQRFIASPPAPSERFSHCLINLSHALCAALFLHRASREEMVALIDRMIKKGKKGWICEPAKASPLAFWNNLLDGDEQMRQLLKHYPNGPLLKTLDVFRDESAIHGFDPFSQDNMPSQLFFFSNEALHITCLRIPAPVHQEFIGKADVIEEFQGFLRALTTQMKGQRLLLFNLQDRTSWQEHSRCLALEEIQKRAEFSQTLFVVTLPKNTDFYFQAANYQHLNDAPSFCELLQEQVVSGEQCGFFFPPSIRKAELHAFVKEAIPVIHNVFFGDKKILQRKNRLDFIEIFYLLLTLKLTEMIRPDSVSFTCKDAIDIGAASNVELFGFLRMMNDGASWSQSEMQFLLWMLYSSSLLVRERAIDHVRLNRSISALAIVAAELEAKRKEVIAACSHLFHTPFFEKLKVKEAM
jgi:hypothetical protein